MKKSKTLTVAVSACLALGCLFGADTQGARAGTLMMEFGKIDNFLMPLKPTTPRAEAINHFYSIIPECGQSPIPFNYQERCKLRQFDQKGLDKDLLHSFDLSSAIASGTIVSATLKTRLKPLGGFYGNDGIRLGLPNNFLANSFSGDSHWYSWISDLNPSALNQPIDLSLDLSSLLTNNGSINLLPMLNNEGFLDVQIQDDTAVDYLTLEIETVPEPGTIAGLAVLGFGFVASKTRKFFGRR